MVFVEAAPRKAATGPSSRPAVREGHPPASRPAGVTARGAEPRKSPVAAQLVYKRDSFFAQALELGELESTGLSYRYADRHSERLKAITRNRSKPRPRVTRRRRTDGGRARPAAPESAPAERRPSGSETLTMRGRALWISTILAVSAPAGAGVKIDQWIAQSGARINFVESHALPIVDVAVEFAAGSAYDSREQAGLARLTLAMLKAGSSRYSETEASRRIADAGAQLQEKFDLESRRLRAEEPLLRGRAKGGGRKLSPTCCKRRSSRRRPSSARKRRHRETCVKPRRCPTRSRSRALAHFSQDRDPSTGDSVAVTPGAHGCGRSHPVRRGSSSPAAYRRTLAVSRARAWSRNRPAIVGPRRRPERAVARSSILASVEGIALPGDLRLHDST